MTNATKDKSLIKVFKRYRKRFLTSGKRPNVKKFLANDLYHTTRLEGEKITKREAKALFR